MRVMFSINSKKDDALDAEKLKNRIVDLFNEFELAGTVQGDKYPSGASYICNYQKRKKKAAKPKPDPKYDPGQYYKGPWDGKKR